MSWDADLICDACSHVIYEQNYTHNTSTMIYAVIGSDLTDQEPWWQHLDGMSGPEGAAWLDKIIKGLEADPVRFEAMNPPNSWGSYQGLLRALQRMRDAVPASPCHWEAQG